MVVWITKAFVSISKGNPHCILSPALDGGKTLAKQFVVEHGREEKKIFISAFRKLFNEENRRETPNKKNCKS